MSVHDGKKIKKNQKITLYITYDNTEDRYSFLYPQPNEIHQLKQILDTSLTNFSGAAQFLYHQCKLKNKLLKLTIKTE